MFNSIKANLMQTRVLTGITTTGTPHLGNYVGAIRPAIAASKRADVESVPFMADYHALIKSDDPARIERSRLEIAATWLAAGLDPTSASRSIASRHPRDPRADLAAHLRHPKGMLNRAHAYKAAVDRRQRRRRADDGINMGLYMYPVLMAADILAFNAHQVPVGATRCSTSRWRATSRSASTTSTAALFFVLPEAVIEEQVSDAAGPGRPQDVQELRQHDPAVRRRQKAAARDHHAHRHRLALPGEPKDPDSSSLFTIFVRSPATRKVRRSVGRWKTASAGAMPSRCCTSASKPMWRPMRERYDVVQKQLKTLGGDAATLHVLSRSLVLELDGEPVASTPDYVDESARDEALSYLREALDMLASQEKEQAS
jgi:tryptophanyl-tRNA synthetase